MPAGAYVCSNAHRAASLVRGLSRNLGQGLAGPVDIKVPVQLEGTGAKGAGYDDVRACGYVGPVHVKQDVRPLEAEAFGAYACGHACLLQHGSHAAVEKKGSVLSQ